MVTGKKVHLAEVEPVEYLRKRVHLGSSRTQHPRPFRLRRTLANGTTTEYKGLCRVVLLLLTKCTSRSFVGSISSAWTS